MENSNNRFSFRAWDKNNKWMLPDYDNWIDFSGKCWTTPDRTYDTPNQEIVRQENIILMQFTGLKDKNGVLIYEGDVVKFLDRDWSDYEKDTQIHTVRWFKDGFILADIKENKYGEVYTAKLYKEYGRDRFEVIGNIYENPELLTSNPQEGKE